mmetsp:Transcript_64507/g.135377  ORF Transcript_64507/g.135377 Transcript_64507/m.135377 type:complete len:458 (-) Transcript_64507:340-1713(-)|eukprot:CAMPEP_0206449988 /NCGR_PEP_ID=MMETSP0324_2-20121206/18437_1 /ASSEMBLY_ACC=CAM_ASM_000836 /TAXON_ID=2866 /ORGANISM="Crypthecodinium cohnii, Strain Seligo" /LENGTH=457 /DNA_ID=CAMNT_0053919511 /DNA_START=130 /DNA_END=1503 /DNA_ORIENTATION=+
MAVVDTWNRIAADGSWHTLAPPKQEAAPSLHDYYTWTWCSKQLYDNFTSITRSHISPDLDFCDVCDCFVRSFEEHVKERDHYQKLKTLVESNGPKDCFMELTVFPGGHLRCHHLTGEVQGMREPPLLPVKGKITETSEWQLISAPTVAPLTRRSRKQEWINLRSSKDWKRHMEKSFLHLDEILKANELQPYCKFCPGQIITAPHLLSKNHISCLPCCRSSDEEESNQATVESSDYDQQIEIPGGMLAVNHLNGEIKMLLADATAAGAEVAQLPPLPPSLSSAASSEDTTHWESEHRPHQKKAKAISFAENAGFTSLLWTQFATSAMRGWKENISNCLDSVKYCELCNGPVANFKKHILAEDHQHQVMAKHTEVGEDPEVFTQVFADGSCWINHLTLETSCNDDLSDSRASAQPTEGPTTLIKDEHMPLLLLLGIGNALVVGGLGLRLLSTARSGGSK